ncbi:MAG TPA: 16S rRNA (cytosine(1402)-N(4))-methyltransferase RsmH [Thermomicrobiales bacterium]|nr:16S rRNA (cytosine(1402)-N(4))-methyltransferase RsmH [Thermomicrobiales bacterium]
MTYFAALHHQPVLWDEAVDALQPKPGGRYADGTFGGGGHTQLLLARSAPAGRVIAFDLDLAAIERGEALRLGDQLVLVHGSFATLHEAAAGMLPLDGVLLDLGFSSYQIDDPERGFSLRLDGPLDMRFDTTGGPSAADLVNELDEQSLADLIWRYGEDRNSRRIAAAVVRTRGQQPIETTAQLAAIVERAAGPRGRIHPATRTFQALRIAVNDELETLSNALVAAVASLAPGGRLAVISFHSLEDRIVKQFIARESATCICPPEQPVCTCQTVPRLKPVGKPVKPSDEEIERNPRSRSAIMRVAERLP